MIAAMMTAANLGARLTGWGFVVFTAGSIAWTTVGFTSGQTNLVASNAFLTLVNLVGIWRWLGKQAVYEDGAKAAQEESRNSSSSTLFTATGINGMSVVDEAGKQIGHAVEALIECATSAVSYVVVASGGVAGVDEQLRAVPRRQLDFNCDQMSLRIDRDAFEALPVLAAGHWPAQARSS
ncbi:PRC-barrel domain-containing protein [Novosphingobium chloroacetimidivorans]